jgi:hypothetical protein
MSKNLATWAWLLTLVALVTSSTLALALFKRARKRRRVYWLAQMRKISTEVVALRTDLSRLMQHVPGRSHWGDERWCDGERKAKELSRSIEQLWGQAPKATRETLWNLIASLRALVIAIGDDPEARGRPARAAIITRRVRDLEPAAHSLESAGLEGWRLFHRVRTPSVLMSLPGWEPN